LSLQRIEACLEFVRTQPREEITLCHALSLADGQIDQQSGNLESEFDLFGGIDAPGKNAGARVFVAGDNQRSHGAHEFG
jgi:hypothetical protein